jgi:hypothetical protein
MRLYKHKEIGKEIKCIAGYYTFLEEIQLEYRGRYVLCAVGIVNVDNSCCGVGGFQFIQVPGYIACWKSDVNENDHFMSRIETIESTEEKKEITAKLEKLYPHSQINIEGFCTPFSKPFLS